MPLWWTKAATAAVAAMPSEMLAECTVVIETASQGTLNDKYSYVKALGDGAFGQVIQVEESSTGKHYAIKQLPRDKFRPSYQNEILIQRKMNHPHIIRLQEVFLTEQHVNIVMDCANGGSLFDFVRCRGWLPEAMARWFFQQLVLAVDYCHQKGVANRDIKLENILLQHMPGMSQPLVRLCDFGYGKELEAEPTSAVGTFAYMAPEVMMNHQRSRRTSYDARAADLWSCGVTLYTMLVGQYPFGHQTHQLPQALQMMATQSFKLPDRLSPRCRSLLYQLLQPDPSKRITISGICHHPWFLQDLPPTALHMNERYLPLPPKCEQSEAELLAIMAAAYQEEESEADFWADDDDDDDDSDGGFHLCPMPFGKWLRATA